MTLTLIIVIMTAIISYQAFSNGAMKSKLMMHPVSVKQNGEFYRFLTSGFVHGDMSHLLINMYVLYIFGETIEKNFAQIFGGGLGRVLFLGLYLGAIIISSIPSYLKHQNNSYYGALGASGGTSAIVFAFVFFAPWQWFIIPPLPGIFMAIGYIAYSHYMSKKGTDNIGHDAHMWGAIYGAIFMVVISAVFNPGLLNYFWQQLMAGPSMPNFL